MEYIENKELEEKEIKGIFTDMIKYFPSKLCGMFGIEDLRFYCAAGLDANSAAAAGTLQSTLKAMLADRDRLAEKAAPAD